MIKYELIGKEHKRALDEVYAVTMQKKSILKNKKLAIKSFRKYIIYNLLLLLLMFICSVMYLIVMPNSIISNILQIVTEVYLFIMVYIIVMWIRLKLWYKDTKCNLKFDKEEFIDYGSNGLVIGYNYNKVEALVIGKYSCIILCDGPICIYTSIDVLDKVKKNILKYCKDIDIINLY